MRSQRPDCHSSRTLRILLLALLLAHNAGCHDYLEIEGQTPTVTIPALPEADCPAGWTGDTLPPALANNLDQTLTSIFVSIGEAADSEIARRNAGTVDDVRITSLSLQVTNAADATDMQSSFGFLADLEIYAESSKVGSALPRKRIAQSSNIPAAATTLPLIVDRDVNLHPYLCEGLRITTDTTARSCLRRNVTYRASYIALVRPK
jgi:hypothetical protein